jgi:hypothetical protein
MVVLQQQSADIPLQKSLHLLALGKIVHIKAVALLVLSTFIQIVVIKNATFVALKDKNPSLEAET